MKKIYHFVSIAVLATAALLGTNIAKTQAASCSSMSGSCVTECTPSSNILSGECDTGICCKSSTTGSCTSMGGSCVTECTPSSNIISGTCDTGVCCKAGGSGGDGGIVIPDVGLPDGGGGDNPVLSVLSNFLGWIIRAFMLLAVSAFVITGIMYLLALGDGYSKSAESAKKYFFYAIIAVVVVGSALIIIELIDFLLGGSVGSNL